MIRVSRVAAGLFVLGATTLGTLIGAIAFDGASPQEGGDRVKQGAQPVAEAGDRWLRGPGARTTNLLGPGLVEDVYLGLSCPVPNNFECDEVTIAVQIEGRARDMRVSVAGRRVEMRPPSKNGRSYWEGSLRPAGLVDGPLSGLAEEGDVRWIGDPTVAAPVTIEVETSNSDPGHGSTDPLFSATYRNIVLHAGYG